MFYSFFVQAPVFVFPKGDLMKVRVCFSVTEEMNGHEEVRIVFILWIALGKFLRPWPRG